MNALRMGPFRRTPRSPCRGSLALLVSLVLLVGACDGTTEPLLDSVPDLLVHSALNDQPVIQGIRLADRKVLFSLPGSSAAWSPDGLLISYVEGPVYDSVSWVRYPGPLVLATARGKRLGVLSEIGGPHSWSPDGTMIAVGYWESGEQTHHESLHVVDSSGGGRRLIAQNVSVWPSRPSWSPDSRQFVIGGAAIFNADGTDITWLEGGGNGSVWSPGGGSIAISVEFDDEWVEYPTCRSEIVVIVMPGGDRTQLTNTITAGARHMESGSPAWSPDGTLIAFRRHVIPQSTFPWGYSHLYVMGADGSNPRRIGSAEDVDRVRAPAWSPDGTMIAYGVGQLVRTVNVDGTTDQNVAEGWDPVWRPVVK